MSTILKWTVQWYYVNKFLKRSDGTWIKYVLSIKKKKIIHMYIYYMLLWGSILCVCVCVCVCVLDIRLVLYGGLYPSLFFFFNLGLYPGHFATSLIFFKIFLMDSNIWALGTRRQLVSILNWFGHSTLPCLKKVWPAQWHSEGDTSSQAYPSGCSNQQTEYWVLELTRSSYQKYAQSSSLFSVLS